MNLHSHLELRRYFTQDLAAHVNYEVAKIWEEGSDWAHRHLLHSVGVGLTYQTPIGLKIQAHYSKNLSLADTQSFGVGLVTSF